MHRIPPAVTRKIALVLGAAATTLLAVEAARASELQDDLESRWRGAWVVTTAETYSDCAGFYSDNRVNGRLVSGRAHQRFKPGEMAKVDSVDLKRSRLDLRLTLAESVLASSQDGPFTLYNEAQCKVELQVELPRDLVKKKDVAGVEALLRPIMERHASEEQARASKAWNRRQREAYPADYEETLARHTVWKAEQANAAVQAGIDRLIDETSRIPDRISDDPDYLAGFVKGVEAGRVPHPVACSDLMTIAQASPTVYPIATTPTTATAAYRNVPAGTATSTEQQARRQRGYQDGLRLTLALDAVHRMPGCLVPIPEATGPHRDPARH
jgi:hypothetical protein